jgi:hypothetical protein
MRIVTFRRDGIVQHGVLSGETIEVHPSAKSAVDLAIDGASEGNAEQVALSAVELLSPVPNSGLSGRIFARHDFAYRTGRCDPLSRMLGTA